MFIGTYRHQFDEKCRLRMPTKFKEALGEGFIVAKGTNGCLFAFSKTESKFLTNSVNSDSSAYVNFKLDICNIVLYNP